MVSAPAAEGTRDGRVKLVAVDWLSHARKQLGAKGRLDDEGNPAAQAAAGRVSRHVPSPRPTGKPESGNMRRRQHKGQ